MPSARKYRFRKQQRAVRAQRGHSVMAGQSAYTDRLALVGKADLRLSAQGDVLEDLAVYRPRGRDAAPETDHLAVLHEERPVQVAVRQLQTNIAAAHAGDEAAVRTAPVLLE